MNLTLSLNKALSLWPDQVAISDGDTRLTYREFGQHVAALASFLRSKDISKGQVVAILSPNIHEFMEVYYACAISGVILAPINFRLSPREISDILEDSETQLVFAHAGFKELVVESISGNGRIKETVWLRERPEFADPISKYEKILEENFAGNFSQPELSAEDLAHLYYTSGTTGKSKGVMLTHGNVSCHALSAIAELSLRDSDTWAHIAPMFHLADAWATFAITWAGGKHVFLPHFTAQQALSTIEREKVTITNLVPTMLTAMLHDPELKSYDYSSLRCLLSGGAPIAPDTVRRLLAAFGCDYVQTYGMTETSPYLTLSLLKSHLRELTKDQQLAIKCRTGRPFISVEMKVVGQDGRQVMHDDSEVGEIIVRGPTVTPGYWKQPALTAQVIKHGWLHTGDLAIVDSEGYVNIVDRKKDMIITGGENVYSTEVEHILYEHPFVLECAVIGLPDDTWGEIVKAVVVPRSGCTPEAQEIITFMKARLAHYKCPKTIDFATELPKTATGKISKRELKERYRGAN